MKPRYLDAARRHPCNPSVLKLAPIVFDRSTSQYHAAVTTLMSSVHGSRGQSGVVLRCPYRLVVAWQAAPVVVTCNTTWVSNNVLADMVNDMFCKRQGVWEKLLNTRGWR